MKGEIDGAPYNKCPLCHEDMPEDRTVCDHDRDKMYEELDRFKASWGGEYIVNMVIQDWLERED